MLKKVIILILLNFYLLASNNIYKVDLYQYAHIVSRNAKVNILIDSKVKANKISFYIPKFLRKKDYINSLSDLVSDYNLKLVKRRYYYYITFKKDKKDKIPIIHLYHYKFKNLNPKDVSTIKDLFKDIDFQYFQVSNILYFNCTKKIAKDILNLCNSLDRSFLTKKISMSIYLFDFKKAKEKGINLSKFNLTLSNLISFTQKSIILSSNNLLSYEGAINFLVNQGVVTILQNPILTITDNKKIDFQSVTNLPYLVSKTSVKDNTVTTQNVIQYRDVGLKISILPRIFKDYIYLDLDLISENLLTKNETPTTSKIVFHNSFYLNNKKALLLTGLNVTQKNIDYKKFPLLGDIPIIKPLFNSKTISNQNRVLTILIKVL